MTTIEELRAKARTLRKESDVLYASIKRQESEEWLPKLAKAQAAEAELRELEMRERLIAEIEAGKAAQ